MPTDETFAYYQGRERASVAMSHAATEPSIRKIHLELARRYAELAGGSEPGVQYSPASRHQNGDAS